MELVSECLVYVHLCESIYLPLVYAWHLPWVAIGSLGSHDSFMNEFYYGFNCLIFSPHEDWSM